MSGMTRLCRDYPEKFPYATSTSTAMFNEVGDIGVFYITQGLKEGLNGQEIRLIKELDEPNPNLVGPIFKTWNGEKWVGQ